MLKDSSKQIEAGDTAAIIHVFELPPNAFCKILVRFDSRYGTTESFFFPTDFSANIAIHFPNTLKLLLIFVPSRSRWPVAPVSPTRSDPARSTRWM